MYRTTLFAGVAAAALIGLGMIVVSTARASRAQQSPQAEAAFSSGAQAFAAVAPPASTAALGVNTNSGATTAPLAQPSMPTRPFVVPPPMQAGAAQAGAWSAQVMTGATIAGAPGVMVAPVPALVAPPPMPSAANAFAPAPASNPFTTAPGGAGFGFAPAPPPAALDGATNIATQAGTGPSQARAAAIGPENEMATRAARASMMDGGAPGGADMAVAPGQAGQQGQAPQAKPDPLAGWGPPPAPDVDPRRFTEAHWQGLEVVPRTPALAKALKLPPGVQGVVVDDVTLPADLQGFQAGDLVTHVGQLPTPDLTSFIRATDVLRDGRTAQIDLLRDKQPVSTMLTALTTRLGTANGETPSMIPPGARMPHEFRGPCTNCHRIGTTGTLAVDQGDLMSTTAPTIRVGAQRPHRDRGPCLACHTVTP